MSSDEGRRARATPAEVSTSISALGGWNWNGNRSVYHHRSPTPNHGSVARLSIESWNQVSRWKTELNWLPDCDLVLHEVGHERPRAGAASSRTSLERVRSVVGPQHEDEDRRRPDR